MKLLFTVVALFFSSICFSQSSLFVYVEGVNDGSAFTRVSLNEISLGTIGVGEHVISDIKTEFNTLSFFRRGYKTKQFTLSSGSDDVFVKVEIGRNKFWTVSQTSFDQLPGHFKSKIQEYKSSKSVSQIAKIDNFYNGKLPADGSTILTIVNPNEDCLSSTPDIIYSYINAVFIEKYRLINRRELNSLLDEQKLSLSGLISFDESIEAGNLIGAKYSLIIDYQCEKGSNKLDLTINLINCETSQIEWVGILHKNKPAQIISDLNKILEN